MLSSRVFVSSTHIEYDTARLAIDSIRSIHTSSKPPYAHINLENEKKLLYRIAV